MNFRSKNQVCSMLIDEDTDASRVNKINLRHSAGLEPKVLNLNDGFNTILTSG